MILILICKICPLPKIYNFQAYVWLLFHSNLNDHTFLFLTKKGEIFSDFNFHSAHYMIFHFEIILCTYNYTIPFYVHNLCTHILFKKILETPTYIGWFINIYNKNFVDGESAFFDISIFWMIVKIFADISFCFNDYRFFLFC